MVASCDTPLQEKEEKMQPAMMQPYQRGCRRSAVVLPIRGAPPQRGPGFGTGESQLCTTDNLFRLQVLQRLIHLRPELILISSN